MRAQATAQGDTNGRTPQPDRFSCPARGFAKSSKFVIVTLASANRAVISSEPPSASM